MELPTKYDKRSMKNEGYKVIRPGEKEGE